ncbi:Piso0_001788 [Millerozyma farinosa CBS 7064]|uniref:Piso0_001788 protein n=1 Tax=Pichia sorbitophila (strain ATCC MYA-4447 / BCRC 22081 / CBS 7064 / NBRC 10061 / NRRL Y-12695) TaxID=559304 RepID=G8YP36_PICSO|nr:Piso0_001788 [Millerozyma farinosa CBS 7064]
MVISELLERSRKNIKERRAKLSTLEDVTSIDIIRDENLKVDTYDTGQRLEKLSLSELNQKAEENDKTIEEINRLWVVNGLLQESKVLVDSYESEEGILSTDDLKSALFNLKKLKAKITTQFDDKLLIIQSVEKEILRLTEAIKMQVDKVRKLIAPSATEINTPIVIEEQEITFKDLTEMLDMFQDLDVSAGSNSLLGSLRFKWDAILNDVITSKKELVLVDNGNRHELAVKPHSESFENYFQSIISFMQYIDFYQDTSVKRFFSSRISRSLVDTISENINKLLHPLNERVVHMLFQIADLSKAGNWSLSVEKTLSSNNGVTTELNNLYLEWAIDRNIDKIRYLFKNEFNVLFPKHRLVKLKESEPEDNEKSMKQKPVDNPEADDWNEDWNEDWDADDEWGNDIDKVIEEDDKTNNNLKVTHVVDKVIEISKELNDQSGGRNDQIDYIYSAIQSLALVSYPPLTTSFFLYNDLKYLSQELSQVSLSDFSESLLKQLKLGLFNELYFVLQSLDLSHDVQGADHWDGAEYQLDIANENKVRLIQETFDKLRQSELQSSNTQVYESLVKELLDFVFGWLSKSIIVLEEISEYQSVKLSTITNRVIASTEPVLLFIKIKAQSLPTYNRLQNTLFLINNHLRDIMDRFYQGELFDLETEELISVIKSVFVKSDLRDNYIIEIREIRSADT